MAKGSKTATPAVENDSTEVVEVTANKEKKEKKERKPKATSSESAESTSTPPAAESVVPVISKKTKRSAIEPAVVPASAAPEMEVEDEAEPVEETVSEEPLTKAAKLEQYYAIADENREDLYDFLEEFKTNCLAEFTALGKLLRESKKSDVKIKTLREKARLRKEQKDLKKANNKNKPKTNEIPQLMSDDLCDFLKVPKGSKMAVRDVNKSINAYAKSNGLKGIPDVNKNLRLINCDAALTKLIGADVVKHYVDEVKKTGKATSGLDSFRLTSVLKHHFTVV